MMAEKEKILIVDDTPNNIHVLMNTLKGDYKVLAATNGEKALQMANDKEKPDIILLDIMMPDMDGYEVISRLKDEDYTKDIPVVFITAMTEADEEQKGLQMGAVDYITKPFNPALVKLRVKNHLELKKHRDSLEYMVHERTKELALTQEVTIQSMATLAEYRDPETGGHINRTQNYVKRLALHLRKLPKFKEYFTDEVIRLLFVSAPLHDIGKVGVPDAILLKPGRLDEIEFEQMKKHALYGHEAIEASMDRLGSESFLRYASEIAYAHHEKWDGSGYPLGTRGDDIPISARLMAIADVYDALISKRVYKDPFTHEKAVSIINEGKGNHFDPDMVDVFNTISEDFRKIALVYADHDEERRVLLEGVEELKVLIAEDQEINAEVLKNQVESLGLISDVAENGAEAMELLSHDFYMAVLTDINMPEMDGYELLEAVRKQYGKIPVIAVTGETEAIDGDKAFRKGFDGYIKKPVRPEELYTALGRYVQLKNLKKEIHKTSMDVVDFSELESAFNDKEKLKSLYGGFLKDCEENISALKKAFINGDFGQCGKVAHAMKGAAATAGAQILSDLCMTAEMEFKAGNVADGQKMIDNIEKAFNDVKKEVVERYE